MDKFVTRVNDDAYTTLGRAIRKFYDERGITIKHDLAREMAMIISEGFLDDVIDQQAELVAVEKEKLKRVKADVEDAKQEYSSILRTIQCQQVKARRLEEENERLADLIREKDGVTVGEVETDPALAGAKKAYDWIFEKTEDSDKACNAFDSYLLGGRYMAGDTYDGDVEKIDSEEILKREDRTRIVFRI